MRPRLGIESSWWAGGRQGSGGQLGTRQPSALSPGSRGHSNHSVSGEQQLCRHCLSGQLLPDAGSIIVHLASFPFLRCFFLISFFLILPSQNGFSCSKLLIIYYYSQNDVSFPKYRIFIPSFTTLTIFLNLRKWPFYLHVVKWINRK